MKVAISTKKELKDPHLEIDINLEKGIVNIQLTYTCPKCAGYGCRHGSGPCDNSIALNPEDVLSILGPEAFNLLKSTFSKILEEKPATPHKTMETWLVMPTKKLSGEEYFIWFSRLESLANTHPTDLEIYSNMKTISVVSVGATGKGLGLLKMDDAYTVNPNAFVHSS